MYSAPPPPAPRASPNQKLRLMSEDRFGLILPRAPGELGGLSASSMRNSRNMEAEAKMHGVGRSLQPKSAMDFLEGMDTGSADSAAHGADEDLDEIDSILRVTSRAEVGTLNLLSGASAVAAQRGNPAPPLPPLARGSPMETSERKEEGRGEKHEMKRKRHDSTMNSFVERKETPLQARLREEAKLEGVRVSCMKTVKRVGISLKFSWNTETGIERGLSKLSGKKQALTWTLLKHAGDMLFFRITFGTCGLPTKIKSMIPSAIMDDGKPPRMTVAVSHKNRTVEEEVVVDLDKIGDMELVEADTHRWFALSKGWQACIDVETGALMQLYFSLRDVEMNDARIKMGICKWEVSKDDAYLIKECVGDRYIPLPFADPDPQVPSTLPSHLVPQRSPRWYIIRGAQRSEGGNWRKLTCGGSSACAQMGFFAGWKPKVEGARSTYEEKLMIARGEAAFPTNSAMRTGVKFEDEVFMSFVHEKPTVTGYEVGWKFLPDSALRHMENGDQVREVRRYMGRIGCSPDGLQTDTSMSREKAPKWVIGEIEKYEREHKTRVDITKGVVEIKVSKKTDDMSGYYFPQMLLEMVCFDRWWCDLIKYHCGDGERPGRDKISVYRYWFSPRDFRTMLLDHIIHMFRVTDGLKGRKPDWHSWKKVPYSDPSFKMRNRFEALARNYSKNYRKEINFVSYRQALHRKRGQDREFVASHQRAVESKFESLKQRMAGLGKHVQILKGAFSVVDRQEEREQHENLRNAVSLLAEEIMDLEEMSADVRDC